MSVSVTQNPIIQALRTITGFLQKMDIPYMVFGGIANSIYGNPRQTFDIDIKFILEDDVINILQPLSRIGKIVSSNPAEFVRETNVIPVDIHNTRVDLVVAQLPFEKEAIHRGRNVDFFGIVIRVCTPEDLIIQKAVSFREKDWNDIHYIIQNLKQEIDWAYLLKHCRDLAHFLDDPKIINRVKAFRDEPTI